MLTTRNQLEDFQRMPYSDVHCLIFARNQQGADGEGAGNGMDDRSTSQILQFLSFLDYMHL